MKLPWTRHKKEATVPFETEQPSSPWKPTEPDDKTHDVAPRWSVRSDQELPPGEQYATGSHQETYDTASHYIAEALTDQPLDGDLRREGDQLQEYGDGAWHDVDDPPLPAIQRDPDPVVDSGVHYFSGLTEATAGDTESCPTCGRPYMSDHQLLVQVLDWLAPSGAEAVRIFYQRLFTAAPHLRTLFPEKIQTQEEKLLSAITALLRLFKSSESDMEQLDSALAKYGRSHVRFDPPASLEEYALVKKLLFEVVAELLGDKLTDRHAAALTRAYEYAAGTMLAAQATANLSGPGRRRRTT